MGHDGCDGAGMPDTNPDAVRTREKAGVSEPVEDEEADA
jgi:hypothetical protein